jgi:hypothetical protein
MAIIFQKESSLCLGLSAREYMVAPLTFSPWTEIRVGMYMGGMDSNFENFNNGEVEDVSVSDVSDYITFGIKDKATGDLPGEPESVFLGVRSTGLNSQFSNYNVAQGRVFGTASDDLQKMSCVGYDHGILVDGGDIRSGSFSDGAIYFPNVTLSEGYCGFYCLKIRINDLGLSSQTASMSLAATFQVEGEDYGPTALRNEMQLANYGPEITINWNDGVSAREIPDSFYIRTPFYRNRFMIACMRAINYT